MTDRWEVRFLACKPRIGAGSEIMCPDGWEPFAAYDGGLWLRRRVSLVEYEEARRQLDAWKAEAEQTTRSEVKDDGP